MSYLQYILLLLTILVTSSAQAQNKHTMHINPDSKEHYFTFTSSKGDVHFNHDLHQAEMKTEICIPCHKTKTPTKANIMTRFDERVAHHFCRGCHRDKGRGPVECHECHKQQK